MAKKQADTVEKVAQTQKDMKAELVQMNKYLKLVSSTDDRDKLLVEIAELTAKISTHGEKLVEKLEEEKKKTDPLHKTISKMADDIGRNTAIARTAQNTLTDMFHNNRELVDIYKKDSVKGESLVNTAIHDMAKAMASAQKLPVELVEKQILATIKISDAMKDSQKIFYTMNKSIIGMANSIQDNLKKWPVLGRFFSEAMVEHYKTIAGDIKHIFNEHMSDILKPVEVLLGPFKAMFKIGGILFKLLKNPKPTMTESRTAHWQDIISKRMLRMNDTLAKGFGVSRKHFDLAEDAAKERKRGVSKKADKGDFGYWVASVLGLVAGALGGLMGGVQLQAIGKVLKPIGTFFRWIGKALKSPWMKMFKTFGGPFLKAFSAGLKYIAWPITILMTVIDFFKGFSKGMDEGGFITAMTTGFAEAIKGFFYLPVKLFGWLADMVMDYFGVSVKGGIAGKIFGAIDSLFEGIAFVWHSIWNSLITAGQKMLSYIPGTSGISSTLGSMKTGVGYNADPIKSKVIADRTAAAGAPAQAKANAEGKTQQQQKDILSMQNNNENNSFDKTINDMGDKISSSIQYLTPQRDIPTAPEETYLALMGDAVGGA